MMRAVWFPRLSAFFEMVPVVHASHAAFVAFDGGRVAACEGEGGGSYFVVADGNVGDVSASEILCVFLPCCPGRG